MQNHIPWVQKGAINGEKGEGALEHNGSELLAAVTCSPWQHLKAAARCQSVVMLRRVMRVPDPGVPKAICSASRAGVNFTSYRTACTKNILSSHPEQAHKKVISPHPGSAEKNCDCGKTHGELIQSIIFISYFIFSWCVSNCSFRP